MKSQGLSTPRYDAESVAIHTASAPVHTHTSSRALSTGDRFADQIAWADRQGFNAMAALAMWTKVMALVWKAIDTETGADAIEARRGIRPERAQPAQTLVVETEAIRIAAELALIDAADVGALTRAHCSVMTATAEGFDEDPGCSHQARIQLRDCAPAVRKLARAGSGVRRRRWGKSGWGDGDERECRG